MTPLSTYRLQLNAGFDLGAARALVPYLAELGVDCVYLSPVFAARSGSAHGYDVTDPTVVNPELGGRPALDAFASAAHDAGMKVLLDVVPNHQAASDENPRWRALQQTAEPGWFDAEWRDGELHYRRFFDIGELVAVRVEDESVFRESHALVFELVADGVVDGLRVDHVDGLADPGEYLTRLHDATGGAYVVVEKILARDETLPPEWPVAGTTGYEVGNALTELLIDPDGRELLEAALLLENGGVPFVGVERDSKEFVLDSLFRPEWARLRALLDEPELTPALRDMTIALDVYRLYDATPADCARFARSAGGLPESDAEALGARLLPAARTELSTRWRQLSSAAMAKGHEDTACYRYPVVLAQAEVGGDPGASTRDARARFDALATGYRGLIATSTHDSKRSEDVRARLCVLSERADAFESGLHRWRELVAPAADVTAVELRFVAQTLLGAWPLADEDLPGFSERLDDYLPKALREAKQATNWIDPDEKHERAVMECAQRTIADDGAMLHEVFGSLVDDVMFFGALNSLAMLTWKLAMPGTPDIYRGCEIWDFSLVDPDNRRPVDFDRRARMLTLMQAVDPDVLLTGWRTGAIKLHVTAAGLQARREHPELFAHGEYVPIEGPDTVMAFARRLGDQWAIAVAPRLSTRVTQCARWPVGREVWGDAMLTLPDERATRIPVAEILAALPVALLVR